MNPEQHACMQQFIIEKLFWYDCLNVTRIVFLWWEFSSVYQQEVVTLDPWVRKHWNHVKILTDTLNYMQSTKTILLWTTFFGDPNFVPGYSKLGCPFPKCFVTSNRSYLNQSDALIFHLRDIDLKDIPTYRRPRQVWILLHHESPHHTPLDLLKQLDGLFNWTATYRSDSEISLSPTLKKRDKEDTHIDNFVHNKKKMVAWLVSNCKTPSNREGFVLELKKTVPIDIYGSCGTYNCLPKMSDECYNTLSKAYRFYLSFENSICKDYVTEKFFRILSTDMVPVVLGGANYSNIAPPNSFIDALAFKTPRDLGRFLLQVAKDEKKYESYFAWRKTHRLVSEHYACQICKKLNQPKIKHSTYLNISNWWFHDANCNFWSHNSKGPA
ncbi:alpha-(1,3)-fucosyltransferase C [Trichonephila clavata]|uniref:Fucosyltransferase n=1 Tax=Trichonephila clavata TaxID=2740835 RepID=A0A8X6FKL7_TRICU|nr:alpha-(1,3)-fucosyltransferase C [Trichonephila clavata]